MSLSQCASIQLHTQFNSKVGVTKTISQPLQLDPGPWAQQELEPLHLSPQSLGWYPPCVQLTPQANVQKKMCLLKCFIFFYRIVQDGRKQLKLFSFNKHLAPDHRSAFIHDIQQEKFPVHYVLCIPSQTLGLSGLHKTVALLHAPGVL